MTKEEKVTKKSTATRTRKKKIKEEPIQQSKYDCEGHHHQQEDECDGDCKSCCQNNKIMIPVGGDSPIQVESSNGVYTARYDGLITCVSYKMEMSLAGLYGTLKELNFDVDNMF